MRKLAFLFAFAPVLAFADGPPRFQSLRDNAEPVANLAFFLEQYLGECSGFFVSADCPKKAEAFREKVNGRRQYLIVSETEASMISNGPYDPAKQIYTVKIDPTFHAGKYLLTLGEPTRLDQQGEPVVQSLQVRGKTPIGWHALRIAKLYEEKRLRVQVIFTPQGPYELKGERGERVRGVNARIDAILITIGETGDVVGLWTP